MLLFVDVLGVCWVLLVGGGVCFLVLIALLLFCLIVGLVWITGLIVLFSLYYRWCFECLFDFSIIQVC